MSYEMVQPHFTRGRCCRGDEDDQAGAMPDLQLLKKPVDAQPAGLLIKLYEAETMLEILCSGASNAQM